jgi:LmbE family N-acetylglucosaminyl deacetylase
MDNLKPIRPRHAVVQVGEGNRGELRPESLWSAPEQLLDTSEEVRVRMKAMDAKLNLMQSCIDDLLRALPLETQARLGADRNAHVRAWTP